MKKKNKYTLLDVARMLISVPLNDTVEINEAKLSIKYSTYGAECEYISELPLKEDEKQNNRNIKGNRAKGN